MAVFGDGTSKKVIKVNWGLKKGAWSNRISVLIKRDTRELLLSPHECAEEKQCEDHSKKVAVCKPRGETSPETKLTRNFIFVFQAPELWEN